MLTHQSVRSACSGGGGDNDKGLIFNMHLTSLLLSVFLAQLRRCRAVDYVCTNGQTTAISVTPDQPAWFQTAGFPNPYPAPSPHCILTFASPTGYGVKLLFEQFFTDSNDVLQFCLTLQSPSMYCTTLTGDPLDFYKQEFVYRGGQQFVATFFSKLPTVISQSPPFVNSGFRGKAVAYQKSQDASCVASSIQLSNGESDIITSPSYPDTYAQNLNCLWTITASDRFRLVFNEFHTMDSDILTIYSSSGSVLDRLSGDVTKDEPYTLYVEKFAKLQFQSSNSKSTVPGFYATVNAYSSGDSTQTCSTSGNFDLVALGDSGLTISTPDFGSIAYPNNWNCQWTVRNTNVTSAIVAHLWLETEHCCDILEVRGVGKEPLAFRGKEARIYFLWNVMQLEMNFSSDGALSSTGFQMVMKAVDCTCDLMKEIKLDANTPSVNINSPGYTTGVGYCNGLQCGWTIRTPSGSSILISISSLQLRESLLSSDSNFVAIQEQFGRTLANYTSQNNSDAGLPGVHVAGNVAQIMFTSGRYFPSDTVARGFALKATMISLTPTVQINQSLSDASVGVPIEQLIDNNTSYMGLWTVRARSGRRIRFYNLGRSNANVQLILLDGPDMTSPTLNSSQANANAVTGKVNPVVSSGEFMTVAYFSQSPNGATRFAALLSDYEDDDYESRCGGFAFVHHSANSPPTQYEQTSINNQQCLSVLYAFKDAGASAYTDAMNFNFQNVGESLSVFRGITTNAQFLIANSRPYPANIYGTFATLQFAGNVSLSFQFVALNAGQITLQSEGGVIMSPDYKANGSPQISQIYSWNGNENGLVFNLETHLYSGTLSEAVILGRNYYNSGVELLCFPQNTRLFIDLALFIASWVIMKVCS
uniref:CUB domain-containing protein n=1 Tax=Plectus sambesii TaxID=2011161 RepID=A0A914WPC9_9BILA